MFVDTARDHQRPRYLAEMPLLDVKVIHLVRDPRGNVASIMKHTKVGVRKAARQWRHYNVEADRVRRRFPQCVVDAASVRGALPVTPGARSTVWPSSSASSRCRSPRCLQNSERHVIGNSMRLKVLDEINEDLSWQPTLRGPDLRTIAGSSGPPAIGWDTTGHE